MNINNSFINKLHKLDPKLKVIWNNKIDRFQILRRNRNAVGNLYDSLMTVQNDDGSFRPLDNRIIEALIISDSHRIPVKQILKRIDDRNKAIEKAKENHLSETIVESIKDNFRQLFGIDMIAVP